MRLLLLSFLLTISSGWGGELEIFKAQLGLDNDVDLNYRYAGKMFFHRKDWEKATHCYSIVFDNRNQLSSQDYIYAGEAYFHLNNWEESAKCYAIAFEKDILNENKKNHPLEIYYHAVESNFHLNNWEVVINYYGDFLKERVDCETLFHHYTGNAYLHLGKWKEASDTFYHYFKMHPEVSETLFLNVCPAFFKQKLGYKSEFRLLNQEITDVNSYDDSYDEYSSNIETDADEEGLSFYADLDSNTSDSNDSYESEFDLYDVEIDPRDLEDFKGIHSINNISDEGEFDLYEVEIDQRDLEFSDRVLVDPNNLLIMMSVVPSVSERISHFLDLKDIRINRVCHQWLEIVNQENGLFHDFHTFRRIYKELSERFLENSTPENACQFFKELKEIMGEFDKVGRSKVDQLLMAVTFIGNKTSNFMRKPTIEEEFLYFSLLKIIDSGFAETYQKWLNVRTYKRFTVSYDQPNAFDKPSDFEAKYGKVFEVFNDRLETEYYKNAAYHFLYRNWEEAVKNYWIAFQKNPHPVAVPYLNAARACSHLELWEEAVRYYELAHKKSKKCSAATYQYMSIAYAQLGNAEKAKIYYALSTEKTHLFS